MGRAFSRPFPGADIPESALTGPEKCDSFLMSEKESCASPLSPPKELTYTEGYRSGDVCERRRGRKKRAKRSDSGRNLESGSEQKISGTATEHNGAAPLENEDKCI